MKFETDNEGNIITKPVVGWTTAPVAEIAVLLAIQYADRPEEVETGGKQIQLVDAATVPRACGDADKTGEAHS